MCPPPPAAPTYFKKHWEKFNCIQNSCRRTSAKPAMHAARHALALLALVLAFAAAAAPAAVLQAEQLGLPKPSKASPLVSKLVASQWHFVVPEVVLQRAFLQQVRCARRAQTPGLQSTSARLCTHAAHVTPALLARSQSAAAAAHPWPSACACAMQAVVQLLPSLGVLPPFSKALHICEHLGASLHNNTTPCNREAPPG